ncbi:hypothetical protein HA402_005294 [Bradysia odoriphaga]|nr:hypothetical protein HA402_005294 [Bradysia odoriphaga]
MTKIEAPLLEVLNGGEPAKIMIAMSDSLETLHEDLQSREYADREEQLTTMQKEVQAFSEKSQAAVIALLEKEKDRVSITWETMFMVNQIIVNGADLKLAEGIAAIENVASITGEKFVDLLE